MSILVENLALSDHVITSVDIDGMMRFLGQIDQLPAGGTVIIDGVEIEARPGDIIAVDGSKQIWDGQNRTEFGSCSCSGYGPGGGSGIGGDYSADGQLSNIMYFPGGVGTKDEPYVMKVVNGMMYELSSHNFVYQETELSLINGCVVRASVPKCIVAFTAVQHDPEK